MMLVQMPASIFAAELFLFDHTDNFVCVAKLIKFPSKIETKLFQTKECPKNITWDLKKKTLYYNENGNLYSRPMGNHNISATLVKEIPETGITLNDMKNAGKCPNCKITDKKIMKLVGAGKGETAGSVQAKSKSKLIFATISGSVATYPVLYCSDANCVRTTELKDSFNQELSISAMDDFFLITGFAQTDDPRVYDAKSGKLVYENHNASSAVWFKE